MKIVWHNGTMYTMENRKRNRLRRYLRKTAKLVAMELYELKARADKEIDLQGAVLYPGFVDSHMHMIGHGEKLLSLDLSKAGVCR